MMNKRPEFRVSDIEDKMVSDPVFGECVLTPLCRAFLHAPEHFRLSHIAMNHANVLFQGVHYSRREHCIAVMELARRWALVFSNDTRLVDLVALAGLYHDAGHVTLSHTMDDFVCSMGIPDHETRSLQVLKRVNRRLLLLLDEEEQFVCDAISGTMRTDSPYPPWAYQIVHQPNRDWPDVDRLVYVLQDTYRLGQWTGIDVMYITSLLYLTPDGHLRFHPECTPQLLLVTEVRARMFQTVFRHPTVRAYQTLLMLQFCDLYGLTRLVDMFSTDAWMDLTDTLLWTTLLSDPESARRVCTQT